MNNRLVWILLCVVETTYLGTTIDAGQHDAPGMGNPLLPGYYADPTVRMFGDTFYLYATTDGTSGGTGPSQVWVSKDFVNWTNLLMNWPSTKFIWAPDVVQDEDNLYYYYYSQPCQIHAGVSETPIGPWKNIPNSNSDGMIIPNQYLPPVITLDWQMFDDDDGKRYGMFCTWAIYPKNGCGMVEVGKDMLPIDSTKWMVPNTQLKDVFEAPYMLKKDGVYYLMYSSGSCHDHTYRVQYATATDIKGPYQYDEINNPILGHSEDMTVHGPGHHSMLEVNGTHYMIYHRHDNPNSNHGMHRQIAVDKMEFGPNHTIKPVVPTHKGVGYLGINTNPFENLTFTRPVKASSYYDNRFKPEFALDDNNGTLWKARDNTFPQSLEVDLEKVQPIKRTWTQFQYPNWYYQYMIEYSTDGKNWEVFSDKRNNQLAGSPMVDFGDVKARYLRLTITGLEKTGMYAAVWNFKAFEGAQEDPPQLLVHLEADDLAEGLLKSWPNTKGMLSGAYKLKGSAEVKIVNCRKAVVLDQKASIEFDKAIPETLQNNQVYTVTYLIKPAGENWQFVTSIADGKTCKTYLNGQLQNESQELHSPIADAFNLQVPESDNGITISALRIYARALFPAEIPHLMETRYQKPAEPTPAPQGLLVDLDASELKMGLVNKWKNIGLSGKEFVPENTTPMAEVVAGVKAVTFKGSDYLKSTFQSPETLKGNANYTVAVWAFNPDIDKMEFMVSWSAHGGLDATSSKLGYGSHPVWGAAAHYGWADLHYKTIPPAGQWHHIAVTFDGSVEKVYVDGRLDNQEDKMLYASGAGEIFLGRGHGAPEFFSGSLASVKMYDKSLSPREIAQLAAQKPSSEVLVAIDTGHLDYGPISSLSNSGSLEGLFETGNQEAPTVEDIDGRVAMAFEGKQALVLDEAISGESGYSIEAYVYALPDNKSPIASWKTDGGKIPALWLPPSKINTWQHVIFTCDVGMYLNGKQLPTISGRLPEKQLKAGYQLVLGSGFQGALAKLAVYNRAVSPSEVVDLFAAVTNDLTPPLPCQFKQTPDTITAEAVGMSGMRANDFSGQVQYYFEEVSGHPGRKSSGWLSDPAYENWNLQPDQTYAYTLRVRDYYGNVSQPTPVFKVKTDASQFVEYRDDFDAPPHDFLVEGCEGTIWDGLVTEGHKNMKVKTAEAESGKLRLEAADSFIDQAAGGPFLYKTISGDFVAEAKVADFQGWKQRRPPGLLEPALMIRVANEVDAGPGQDHVRSGIFPYWNCGNLWTSLDGGGRPQGNNQSGYNANLYLQIQRSGEWIFLRTSPDGKAWKPLPNTPIHRRDMAGLPLQVGLSQTIGQEDKTGWVDFDWFRVMLRQ